MSSVGFDDRRLVIDGLEYPLEWAIEAAIDLGLLVVVMFEPEAQQLKWGQFANIAAFRRDGQPFWTAELPTSETGDRYYSLAVGDGQVLKANSVKSYRITLDPLTGRILEREFTK